MRYVCAREGSQTQEFRVKVLDSSSPFIYDVYTESKFSLIFLLRAVPV